MKDLDRHALEALVKGTELFYASFGDDLVIKAGHHYVDSYGQTTWNSLDKLTDQELYELYLICKNSFSQQKQV